MKEYETTINRFKDVESANKWKNNQRILAVREAEFISEPYEEKIIPYAPIALRVVTFKKQSSSLV